MARLYSIENYKILSLVDPSMDGCDVNMLDFTRHLQPDKTLCKTITKGSNGRPIKVEYCHDEILYAVIDYEFVDDSDGMMVSRKLILKYVKNDDTLGEPIIIKDKDYAATLEDGEIVMKEREQSRKSIIDMGKAYIAAVLKSTNTWTMDQVVVEVQPFWDEYSHDQDNFINLGISDYKVAIQAIDLQTTAHTWLGTVYNQDGDTLKDYLVDILTF